MKAIDEMVLKKALTISDFSPESAWKRFAPDESIASHYSHINYNEKKSAVAVIFISNPERPDDPMILFTRRSSRLKSHAGQIAFPGGAVDEGDESPAYTAIRESCEEIGLCSSLNLKLLGKLSSIYVPVSQFRIYPYVFFHQGIPDLDPSEHEVEEVYLISVSELFNSRARQQTERTIRSEKKMVPCYQVNQIEIWGATAAILSELEIRIQVVMNHSDNHTIHKTREP